nr:MAG TPA: hypothetical protein [Caudoviricetes sp.]
MRKIAKNFVIALLKQKKAAPCGAACNPVTKINHDNNERRLPL